MQNNYQRDIEFRLAPSERAKSSLRQTIYQMSEKEFRDIEQTIGEVWKDTIKLIEQKAGQSVYEMAAQQIAKHVADGRTSLDTVKEYVSRLPAAWEDRSKLVRCLQVHFPAETFEPVLFKQQYPAAYTNEAVKAYEEVEAHHRELAEKVLWGEATASERISELLVGAELEAAEGNWGGDYRVERRLHQQRIEAVIWFLEKLLRPLSAIAKGKATVPMLKRGGLDTPAMGFTPLLDYLSF